jgi:hypothetical protein
MTTPLLVSCPLFAEGDKSRTRYMNRTDAKRRFALENIQVNQLESIVVDHPHYKNKYRMRLYLVSDLEVRACVQCMPASLRGA